MLRYCTFCAENVCPVTCATRLFCSVFHTPHYGRRRKMSDAVIPVNQPADIPEIKWRNIIWALIAIGVMVVVIIIRDFRLLNFIHVLAGLLWTGTDLFMGFAMGPIMRRLDLQARRSVILRLMPKMIFYMPTLAIITPTAGFYLASMMGYLNVGFPQYWWMVAVYFILAVLTIQGLGILLPTNLRVYFEMRREKPDGEKIQRMMRSYFRTVAIQGAMQIAIIFVMSHLATGI